MPQIPDSEYPWWWASNFYIPTFGEMGLDSRKMRLRDINYWPNHDYFCASEQLWALKFGLTDL